MSRIREIFANKAVEVQRAKASEPIEELKRRIADVDAARDFRGALAGSPHRVALIAEVKKASPSMGVIREEFDPVGIAESYRDGGADCLSVLTDERYFQGSRANLEGARAASGLPCLRKDFIFDEYQVYESRAWGADCILLILAAFTVGTTSANAERGLFAFERARELATLARQLGMGVLVEVHSQWEATSAPMLGSDLVGVNNRNLADMSVSIATSEDLLPQLSTHGLTLVSESALETRADVDRVQAAGARAVLIGTTFCAAPDIAAKVREVMGW